MTVSYRGYRKWMKSFAELNLKILLHTPLRTVAAARQTLVRHRIAFITQWLPSVLAFTITVSYRGGRKWLKCFAALNMSYYCTPAEYSGCCAPNPDTT